MKKEEYKFTFEVYESIGELNEADADLLTKAQQVTQQAYAPYSNFKVGAAARLNNGEIVTGTNQENASFPVGICAERTLLAAASSLFPQVSIDAMAVSFDNKNGNSDHPISPCGLCRQSLLEYEIRTKQLIKIILGGFSGKVYIIDSAARLLPLSFSADELNA